MSLHPDEDTLRLLVAGKLESPSSDALLRHLSECDGCLASAEAAWGGIEDLSEFPEPPALDRHSSSRIERQLFRRVHGADLGSQISWLATTGFLTVVLVLLRPIIGRVSDSGSGRR